jgi:hypothetical protein
VFDCSVFIARFRSLRIALGAAAFLTRSQPVLCVATTVSQSGSLDRPGSGAQS